MNVKLTKLGFAQMQYQITVQFSERDVNQAEENEKRAKTRKWMIRLPLKESVIYIISLDEENQ